MITLKELIQRENLNIELPQKLSNFQLYIDTETYKYEKEIQDGNIIHIFDGNIEKMNDEPLIISYNETQKELMISGKRALNAYNENGEQILMS